MIYRLYHCVVIKIYKKIAVKSRVLDRVLFIALKRLFLNYHENSLLQPVIYNCTL
jgi:hypothetical protein